MSLRRCLSIGLSSTLVACGLGLSGLQRIDQKPPEDGDSPGRSPAAVANDDDSGPLFGGGDPAGDAGSLAPATPGAEAGPMRDASPDQAEGGTSPVLASPDAEIVDVQAVGCPDKAACPAGLVCCAEFQDGGFVLAFDDAGALETSCHASCTPGTSPLCSVDTDCGDAGGLCFKDPPTSARGFCTGSISYGFP